MNFWTIFWIIGIIVGLEECSFGICLTYMLFLIINVINIQRKKKNLSPLLSLPKKEKEKQSLNNSNENLDINALKHEIKNELYAELLKEIKIEINKKQEINQLINVLNIAKGNITKQQTFILNVSPADTAEMRKEVGQAPRDESLEWGRLLWESYYKIPYNNMIEMSKVKKLTGIYKITNTQNGKVYIGQAVNIAERWRQHIKAGIGAEFPSGNLMYKDMLQQGPETFTFEVQEKCDKSQLNAREKYWISFYDTYNQGYNQTSGNKD